MGKRWDEGNVGSRRDFLKVSAVSAVSGTTPSLTVSLGVSSAAAGAPHNLLLRSADAGLYAAKSSGRNCFKVEPASIGDR